MRDWFFKLLFPKKHRMLISFYERVLLLEKQVSALDTFKSSGTFIETRGEFTPDTAFHINPSDINTKIALYQKEHEDTPDKLPDYILVKIPVAFYPGIPIEWGQAIPIKWETDG